MEEDRNQNQYSVWFWFQSQFEFWSLSSRFWFWFWFLLRIYSKLFLAPVPVHSTIFQLLLFNVVVPPWEWSDNEGEWTKIQRSWKTQGTTRESFDLFYTLDNIIPSRCYSNFRRNTFKCLKNLQGNARFI